MEDGMAIELNPDITVRRDGDGQIRQLQHIDAPYRGDESPVAGLTMPRSPRRLADSYLKDVAEIYALAPRATSNLAALAASAPSEAPPELRFKEEKNAGTSVTVAYDQTVLGLPIWNAGMTVRIDGSQMHVTGSHNATHYEVDPVTPVADAAYLPNAMDVATVARILGLPPETEGLVVNATRLLVYRYDPADRLGSQAEAHGQPEEMTGFGGPATPPYPSVPLPPVAEQVEPGRHYVVTELLFSLPAAGWGPLNWRAFVEPGSGAILYIRPLVACAASHVFTTNPLVSAGTVLGAADPVPTLDQMRSRVILTGLVAAGPAGQPLVGEYVRLVDLEPPGTNLPLEASPFEFDYSCDTDNFAACNAYHHCDGFFRLLDDLGFDVGTYFNNTDFPVPVDPHAFDGQVNAAAPGNISGNGLGKLVFGLARENSTFGIAADNRVVIHEFGHAVLWDHVSSPNFGWAHSPGDSLAVILHDPETQAPDRFETFPFMNASAGLSRRHDRDVTAGWAWGGSRDDRQYGSEQILSTTLFRVYRAAGGDSNDRATRVFASRYVAYLILKAVSLLSFPSRDPDVYVSALTEADATNTLFEGHPGGAFTKLFRWSFEQQGLYQPAGAPTPVRRPGAPPDVDVFIEDGRQGGYMPYRDAFEGHAEIWNRQAADGGAADELPAPGVTNYAYVAVRNRGTRPATALKVRGFKSRAAGASVWPTDWEPLETAEVAVAAPLAPGARVVVGPFAWTPQGAGESLLFAADAAGDRSTIDLVTAGPIANSRLVPLDNNLAQKSY
jgi:hypothetical protein